MSSDEGVASQVTKSQADRQFPKEFKDKKYLTATLKKDELVRRLQKLHKFLEKVGDEPEWQKEALDDVAAALIQSDRLEHKDKDVRLLVACALADIIRIYAPDAPYDDEPLKNIFELFLSQLASIGSTSDASHALRYYLLDRLSSVRAFVLLIGLDEQLYLRMYDTFFDIMSKDTSIEVVNHFLDVMSACLNESEEISQDLMEKILGYLLPDQKEARPHAFRLAQALVKGNVELLENSIMDFMNDILVNFKSSTSELKSHSHALIWELSKISPNLLLRVMPELEKQLTVEDAETREDTVELLGKIFSADHSRMINGYPQLFASFLRRFGDVEPSIRRRMVVHAAAFLTNLPSLDLGDALLNRVRDPDETVRAAALDSICTAARANPFHFKKEVLSEVGLRMRDKKPGVRKLAMVRLAQLYRDLCNRDWANDEMKKVERAYGWIPTKILHLYFQTDIDIRVAVDEVVSWELLSRDKGVKERTNEFLQMLPSFDERAHQALARLLKEKREFQLEFVKYLEARKKDAAGREKGGKVSDDVAECFQRFQLYISAAVPRLQALNATKQKELWTALRQLADEDAEFKAVRDAVRSLESQAKQKSGKAKTSAASGGTVADLLRAVTYRLAMGFVSRQAVPLLLKSLQTSLRKKDDDSPSLLSFLHEVSASYPQFFADATDDLPKLLQKDQAAATIDSALRMLAHVGQHGLNWPRDLRHHLAELCTVGTPKQAKHAVRAYYCIFPDQVQKGAFAKLASTLVKEHLDVGQRECGPALAALAHMAKVSPAVLTPLAPTMLPWLTDELLTAAPSTRSKAGAASGEASFQARLKVLGLRLLANYTLAHHQQADGKQQARETMRLLLDVLRQTEPEREASDDDDDEEANGDKAEARYKVNADRELTRSHAVGALLRLAQVRELEALLEVEDFHLVASTVRDPASEVREHVIDKLWAGVRHPTRLGLKWLAMLGLAGLDSDKKLLQHARGYLSNAIRVRRQAVTLVRQEDGRALFSILPEYALPYLIHLLAHRPDWEADAARKFQDSSRFLMFFLEPIMTHGDNFTFLVELLKFIKQTKDGITPGREERMRILCDIGALFVKQRGAKATARWLNQKRHPGDLYLPPKYFQLDAEQLNERAIQDLEKSYLPLDFSLPSGRSNLIYTDQPKTPARPGAAGAASPSRKAGKKTPAKGGSKTKTPATKRKGRAGGKSDTYEFESEDEEEEEEAASGDEEEAAVAKNKKQKTTTAKAKKTTTTPAKKGGKATTPAKRRGRAESDDEAEERDNEEDDEEEKTSAKAKSKKTSKTTTTKTSAKRKRSTKGASEEEEEEEEHDEEEEAPAKKRKTATTKTATSTTKGKGAAAKRKAQEEEEEEEEEKESPSKKRRTGAAKRKAATPSRGRKAQVAEEEEDKSEQEEEEEEEKATKTRATKGRGKAGSKASASTTKGKGKQKPQSEQEEEDEGEEEEELPITHRATTPRGRTRR